MINRVHYQGLVDSYVLVFALSTGSSCPAFFQAFTVNIEA